ncbi:MAG: hypothetical protein ABII12_07550 [Planctomycetota bacterium]
MPTLALRLTRSLGWIVLVCSVGVVVGAIVWQSAQGPEAGQDVWPTARLWRCLFRTLWMAAGATIFALLLSIPCAYALVQPCRRWQRVVLHALVIVPLVSPPSVFAYAWLLLSTSRSEFVAGAIRLIGWNTAGWEPLQAAWVQATWLWPICALVLALAFKHTGQRAYQLACIDASPTRAFLRGALPVMRAPVIAAVAMVFILAAFDSNIPPLMSAGETWAAEMVAIAAVAGAHEHPVAYLAWHAWPMLLTIALLAAAAMPGLRQMAGWGDDTPDEDTGSHLPSTRWTWPLACLIAIGITVMPIAVFAVELATARGSLAESLGIVWKTAGDAILATLVVAALAVVASLTVAAAVLDEPGRPRFSRFVSRVAVGLVIAVAVIPPELTGAALLAVFGCETISPRGAWNVYDNSPLVWTAAMVARFAFLPVCVVRLLNRRLPQSLSDQALSDGGNYLQRITHTRLPVLWRPVLAAGLLVGCLTLSEITASQAVQPSQFIGGSLAVHVDAQMHYGRQNETVATSLLLILPAVLIAVVVPLVGRLPRSVRHAEAGPYEEDR